MNKINIKKKKISEHNSLVLFNKDYIKYINNIDKSYTNLIQYYIKNNIHTSISYDRRDISIALAYFFNTDTINTITTTFKINSSETDDKYSDTINDVIFGLGFYEYYSSEKKSIYASVRTRQSTLYSKLELKYFIINGSYESKDGEFRNGILSEQTLDIIKSPVLEKFHLNELLIDITKYIKEFCITKAIGLYEDFFYPSEEIQMSVNYKDNYENINMLYVYFAMAWFKFFTDYDLNILPNHLSEKYKNLFTLNELDKKDHLLFFNRLKSKYSDKTFKIFRYVLNHFIYKYVYDENDLEDLLHKVYKFGQKIIPLSISEVSNPFSMTKKPWREYLISIRLSDFVINNIAPGFAIINSWHYIKNSKKGLFDNEIQYDKMERSEMATQISLLLKRAYDYSSSNEGDKYAKKYAKVVKSIVTDQFKKLTHKINKSIDFVNNEILMSDVALNIISEYVGRTYYDMIRLSSESSYYNKSIGFPFSPNNEHIFIKYMFEICYSLLCLHSKAGVMHGDLHMNNVTIKPINYNVESSHKSKILYIVDDTHYYMVPDTNYIMCIIDFSRSIILPDYIYKYSDSSLPKSFKPEINLEKIQDLQIDQLIKLYKSYTNSAINVDELKFVFSTQFEAVFKLLSVMDIYGIVQKTLESFKILKSKVSAKIIKLLKNILNDSKVFLNDFMNKLLFNNSFSADIKLLDFPLKTIIINNFSEFILSKHDKINCNISDIYNINNKMEYSLNILNKFPKYLTEPKDKTKANIDKTQWFINNRTKYEEIKRKNMNTINYIANRQYSKAYQ